MVRKAKKIEKPDEEKQEKEIKPTPAEVIKTLEQQPPTKPKQENPAEPVKPDLSSSPQVSPPQETPKPPKETTSNPPEIVSAQEISYQPPAQLEEPPPQTPEPPQMQPSIGMPEDPKSNKKMLLVSFVLIAIIISAGGSLFYWFKMKGTSKPEKKIFTTKSTKPSTPSAVPTTGKINLSEYKIKVLNGSGIVGEAGKVKSILEEAGFTVTSTDNADNYDFRETVIQTKKSAAKELINKLKETIEKSYISTQGANLTDKDEVDALVTVGNKKK